MVTTWSPDAQATRYGAWRECTWAIGSRITVVPKLTLPVEQDGTAPTRVSPHRLSFTPFLTSNSTTQSLHRLSIRLSETPTYIQAPPPASERIQQNQFSDILKSRWNQEVEYMAAGFRGWGQEAAQWGISLLDKLPSAVAERSANASANGARVNVKKEST